MKHVLQTNERVIPFQELSALSEKLKKEGRKIVLTNGIFDFLHAGHASYLEQAKVLGDVLVIGVNSDASTKRLKGEGRPINGEQERAFILASLRCVDYVSIFEEDTATEVIKALKPDVYAKGGDYTPESLAETPFVMACGGKVKIIPLLSDYSNTKQYNKIKEIDSNTKRADTVSTR